MSRLVEMYQDPRDKGKYSGPTTPVEGYEWVTAGDSTVLLPVQRRASAAPEEANTVEIRAGRGPLEMYISDEQAQADYDDMLASEARREENARQRDMFFDLFNRATSLAPWLGDVEQATGKKAPGALKTASNYVGPSELKLLAMPWFIARGMGPAAGRKMAFARQASLDAAGDPGGIGVQRYLDEGYPTSIPILDEGMEGTGAEVLYRTPAERQAAEWKLEKTARAAAARHEAMEASKKKAILDWAIGTDADDIAIRPYRTKLERRAQEFAEQQRALREQEYLYETLDAANRRQGLPVDEVVHDYVRPPVRKKNSYDGDPSGAQRLYGYYPPAD